MGTVVVVGVIVIVMDTNFSDTLKTLLQPLGGGVGGEFSARDVKSLIQVQQQSKDSLKNVLLLSSNDVWLPLFIRDFMIGPFSQAAFMSLTYRNVHISL